MFKAQKTHEEMISEQAISFIKKNKKLLIEKFANNEICLPSPKNENPVSFFMAGSPGAGKTEFSKGFLMEVTGDAIRIDADEIRCIIPSYNGENSHILQSAASIGVEKLYDYVLNKRKSAIIDGTLAIDFTKVANNLERSLF